MKNPSKLSVLGVALALLFSVAAPGLLANTKPSRANEDTVTALAKVVTPGAVVADLRRLFGAPDKVVQVETDTVEHTYRGIRYDIVRGGHANGLPVLYKSGDFAPGSTTVRVTFVKGVASKIVCE